MKEPTVPIAIIIAIFALKFKTKAVKVATHLVISKGTELYRFPLDCLVFIEADGNYSYATTLDGKRSLICEQLGNIEELIAKQMGGNNSIFIRIGRSLIVNKDYIYHIDISRKVLVMSDCKGLSKELSASREALISLKEFVEKSVTPNT